MTSKAQTKAEAPSRSPEQRRASHALRAVQDLPQDAELRKLYRAYTDRLGPAILMNGLGQALATERAASGNKPDESDTRKCAHARLYRNLQAWLCGEARVYPQGDLLTEIVKGPESRYLQAQTEALAWLTWHKKLCRAELPAPEPGQVDP